MAIVARLHITFGLVVTPGLGARHHGNAGPSPCLHLVHVPDERG
ncbi:hypothetical protein AB0G60_00615 [Streptomyces angustmyceticus]|uniref:Uncharacterized protein n=1 Tax=Streptomyces angustmyceticus TaxID=285578 RepID=A0A5J4L2I2_9ACTN|nr:hypothetical protein [Streptomyces angustmyceticus]GES28333.1 hypothetical protein San01_08200 [Streptomyces angustmyceticus]